MNELPGIGRFDAQTDRDHAQWARLARFVSDHGSAAFSRDPLIGGHVTGSAFVLSADGGAALLTHHRKLDRWLQLGGHCDGIADARFVAQKEAYEESGLARIALLSATVYDVDIHEIPANGQEPAHLHYDIRFLMQAQAGALHLSNESKALAWVPLQRIGEYTNSASVLRLCDRLKGFARTGGAG